MGLSHFTYLENIEMLTRRKAFTLIELLVVISIIALLVAILMPALNKAKEHATGAVCLSNQKALILAWMMYADDNDDKLCSSVPSRSWYGFVANPRYEATDPVTGNLIWQTNDAVAQERAKIEACKQGMLWPYLKAVEVFHCPGDRRSSRSFAPGFGSGQPRPAFRTYSLPHGLNSEVWNTFKDYKKLSEIKRPAWYYCFVEEDDPRGYNQNHWTQYPTDYDRWGDTVAIWHNAQSSFSFCDGHAEMHKWEDPITIMIAKKRLSWNNTPPSPGSPDIRWVKDHYPYNGRE